LHLVPRLAWPIRQEIGIRPQQQLKHVAGRATRLPETIADESSAAFYLATAEPTT